jgi:hypothetical protein
MVNDQKSLTLRQTSNRGRLMRENGLLLKNSCGAIPNPQEGRSSPGRDARFD